MYKAFWISKQREVAVKVSTISNSIKREFSKLSLLHEINISNKIETLGAMKHKSIVQFYGVYENTELKLCLVLGAQYYFTNSFLKINFMQNLLRLHWISTSINALQNRLGLVNSNWRRYALY